MVKPVGKQSKPVDAPSVIVDVSDVALSSKVVVVVVTDTVVVNGALS